jgi:hypothetical protein
MIGGFKALFGEAQLFAKAIGAIGTIATGPIGFVIIAITALAAGLLILKERFDAPLKAADRYKQKMLEVAEATKSADKKVRESAEDIKRRADERALKDLDTLRKRKKSYEDEIAIIKKGEEPGLGLGREARLEKYQNRLIRVNKEIEELNKRLGFRPGAKVPPTPEPEGAVTPTTLLGLIDEKTAKEYEEVLTDVDKMEADLIKDKQKRDIGTYLKSRAQS